MKDFQIITDSSCDLPSSMVNILKAEVVPLTVRINNEEFTNFLDWREISPKIFYNMLREGDMAQTSAPNIDDFTAVMEKVLQTGKDILYIAFTSTLSSTYNNGRIAAELLMEKYPERDIRVLDTLSGGMGQGILVYLAAIYKRMGKNLDETAEYINRLKLHICHFFSVADLKHLRRGGRVSATTATVGSILNIRPVMHLDNNGVIVPISKVRTQKALINTFVENFHKSVVKPEKQTVFIGHADCEDDAKILAARLREKCRIKKIIINHIGPVLGAHGGPGALALFFIGECR